MVQESRVHGLAHWVVAAEGKRQVADAPTGFGFRQVMFDPLHCTDKVDAIVGVGLDARAYRQHVDIEDDVLRREICLFGQQAVGTLADVRLALVGHCLSFFVKGHHHHGCSVGAQASGLGQEILLAVFQTDGVDDTFSLCVAQSGDDGVPV